MPKTKLTGANNLDEFVGNMRSTLPLDSYCKFTWNAKDMYNEYGAFITGDKGSVLSPFNGASFSNEYGKPQFESATSILNGVTFSQPTISLNLALYAVSIEQYNRFLKDFDPYEIAFLTFDYNPKWSYLCKVNKIGNTTRTYLTSFEGEPLYLMETSITFDLVGDPVAYATNSLELYHDDDNNNSNNGIINRTYFLVKTPDTPAKSLLPYPFQLSFSLEFPDGSTSDSDYSLGCSIRLGEDGNSQTKEKDLFNIVLSKEAIDASGGNKRFNFVYDSRTGLLSLGDSSKLISLKEETTTGERLVKSMFTSKCFISPDIDVKRNNVILFQGTVEDGQLTFSYPATLAQSMSYDESTGVISFTYDEQTYTLNYLDETGELFIFIRSDDGSQSVVNATDLRITFTKPVTNCAVSAYFRTYAI